MTAMSLPNRTPPREAASVSPTAQSARRHAMSAQRAHSEQIRRSSGPLSSQTMATIRCPSRADFFQAVSAGDPCTKLPATAAGARQFAVSAAAATAAAEAAAERRRGEAGRRLRQKTRQKRLKGRHEPQNVPVAEEDDECVPVYLNAAVLDAIDRQEEYTELTAIVYWLDDLREKRGFPVSITDVDLSNGVALLDALYIIEPSLFTDIEYPPTHSTDTAGQPQPYVVRTLDEDGKAARINLQRVRDALSRFPWRDVNDHDRLLASPNFNSVDTWALGGFVVLAAVNGANCEDLVNEMLCYDKAVQDDLGDIVARGLRVLGARTEEAEGAENAKGAEDAEDAEGAEGTEATETDETVAGETEGCARREVLRWRMAAERAERLLDEERAARVEAERRELELEAQMRQWKGVYDGVEGSVEMLTRQLEETRAEARRLKAERGAGRLRRLSGGGADENVVVNGGEGRKGGKGTGLVQELRRENAALRRKVIELERRRGFEEREAARCARDAAWVARGGSGRKGGRGGS